MAITGVQSVVYGVEDLEKSIRFHRDFGLDAVSENGAGADFELADGSTILVRRKDDPSLPDDALSKPTVRELIWWVDSEEALDKLERNLAVDREARRDGDGVLHTVDPYGIGIGFRVFAPRSVAFGQVPANTPDRYQALERESEMVPQGKSETRPSRGRRGDGYRPDGGLLRRAAELPGDRHIEGLRGVSAPLSRIAACRPGRPAVPRFLAAGSPGERLGTLTLSFRPQLRLGEERQKGCDADMPLTL